MESTDFAWRSIKSELSPPECDLVTDSCRLCMARNTAMKQLFKAGTDSIVEMIRFCTGVEFTKEEDLPTQICKSCTEDLSIAHAFKTLCLSADTTFRKYLVSNRTKLYKTLSCEKSMQRMLPAPSEDKTKNNVSNCDDDNKDELQHSDDEMVIDVAMVKDELLEEQKPNVGLKKESDSYSQFYPRLCPSFECHICFSSFTSRNSWKNHLLQQHGLTAPVKKRDRRNAKQAVKDLSANFINVGVTEGNFFECNICHSWFLNHDCWKNHLLEHHEVAVPVEDAGRLKVAGELSANMNVREDLTPSKDENRNSNVSDNNDNGVTKQSDSGKMNHGMVVTHEMVREQKTNISEIGEQTTENGNRFKCPICCTSWLTRRGWRQHQLRTHGVRAPRLKPGRKKKQDVEDPPSTIKMNVSESVQGLPLPSTDENRNSNVSDNDKACNEMVNHGIVVTGEMVEEPKNINEMCILETEDGIRFYCPICYSSCLTRKGWRKHQLQKHGVRAPSLKTGPKKKRAAGVPPNNYVVSAANIKEINSLRKVVLTKNEADYICEVCGKASKQMGAHQNHLMSHLPARFFCDHCEYKTQHKADLLKHIRIHSGIKMYRCEHCPVSCYTSSNLFRHIRCVHERVKPHPCHICGHKCFDKRTLRTHIDSHNGIQRFQCDICHSGFRHRYSWKKHLQRQHGVAVPVLKAGRRKKIQIVGQLSANNIDVMRRDRTTRSAAVAVEGDTHSFS